jgi:hypothetical protein
MPELLIVKTAGTYSYHRTLRDWCISICYVAQLDKGTGHGNARPAVLLTHSRIQGETWAVSPGVMRPWRDAERHSSRSKFKSSAAVWMRFVAIEGRTNSKAL